MRSYPQLEVRCRGPIDSPSLSLSSVSFEFDWKLSDRGYLYFAARPTATSISAAVAVNMVS
jgi:hypothetical protein